MITSGYHPDSDIARFPYSLLDYSDLVGGPLFDVMWEKILSDICRKVPDFIGHCIKESDYPVILFGLDVEFDADFRPWLLEINLHPDMTIKNDKDRVLKLKVMQDVANLVYGRTMSSDSIEVTET